MLSEHQCFTGASGRRGWAPIVLQRDQFSMRRKMVSDGKVVPPPLSQKKIRTFEGLGKSNVCQCLSVFHSVSLFDAVFFKVSASL